MIPDVQTIREIIDRSRHCDEMFLTDSKKAAEEIIKLLTGVAQPLNE